MEFDVSRLRRGERLAAIGGVVLFILLFFHWYNVDVEVNAGGFSSSGAVASGSAWEVFSWLDIYLLIVAIVAVGLAALTATQRTPALPVTGSVITTALAALGALGILYRIVDAPGPSVSIPGGSVDVNPTIWAFAGLVVTAGIAYAGYLAMRDEGTTLGDAADQARAAGRQARTAFDDEAPASAEGASAPPPAASEEPAASAAPEPPPPPPPPPPPAPTEERTAFGEPLAGARPGIDEHPQGDPAVGSTAPPPDQNP